MGRESRFPLLCNCRLNTKESQRMVTSRGRTKVALIVQSPNSVVPLCPAQKPIPCTDIKESQQTKQEPLNYD